ncbi:MAG: 1,2-phenylacetyl-CoA epoxidase subunit PaaE [Dermatophilaceae bacterium]
MTSLLTKPARHRARFHTLTVTEVERLTEDAVAVSFAIPDDLAQEFAFEPGQHLTLRATVDGQDVRRSYSICRSRPEALERKELRIASARLPGGLMSNWLNDKVVVGDEIEVMTPLGGFTSPTQPDGIRHHVAIAAGSGITPVMSLLSSALAEEPRSRATLIFGNRHPTSIMFLEELEDLKNRYPDRFHLINVLSREAQDVELFSGRLDRQRLQEILDSLVPVATVDEWYLCGPFGLVEGAQRLLADLDVDSHHVHHEVFHVDDDGVPVVTGEPVLRAPGVPSEAVVTVNLDGRTTVIEMPSRGETILAATLRARPDAPFSCTGGVCGTCRARLVEGEVRMDRNYALEPEEVAAGIVLACQSHPVTATVALDYDA